MENLNGHDVDPELLRQIDGQTHISSNYLKVQRILLSTKFHYFGHFVEN